MTVFVRAVVFALFLTFGLARAAAGEPIVCLRGPAVPCASRCETAHVLDVLHQGYEIVDDVYVGSQSRIFRSWVPLSRRVQGPILVEAVTSDPYHWVALAHVLAEYNRYLIDAGVSLRMASPEQRGQATMKIIFGDPNEYLNALYSMTMLEGGAMRSFAARIYESNVAFYHTAISTSTTRDEIIRGTIVFMNAHKLPRSRLKQVLLEEVGHGLGLGDAVYYEDSIFYEGPGYRSAPPLERLSVVDAAMTRFVFQYGRAGGSPRGTRRTLREHWCEVRQRAAELWAA